jgi:hypothetical protein
MKVPTVGTSVFSPVARTGTGAIATVTSGFATDMVVIRERSVSGTEPGWYDKLRGQTQEVRSNRTSAEVTNSSTQEVTAFINTGITLAASANLVSTNTSGFPYINWMFGRAPGFFDIVCYTGTGSATTFAHNLGVVPELIIVKKRSTTGLWATYVASVGNTSRMSINTAFAPDADVTYWNNTTPTSSVFTVGSDSAVNSSSSTFVAYLFATLANISKVGSYTGTGATQTINCGFTGGARFVLIKRTDTTGDWIVWDTARGMTSGTDPYLFLNSDAAEVNANNVYTITTGFQLVSANANTNASGGTYIFLAIA